MGTEIKEEINIDDSETKPKRKSTKSIVAKTTEDKETKNIEVAAAVEKPKGKTTKKTVEIEEIVEVAAKPKRKTKAKTEVIVEAEAKPTKKAKAEKTVVVEEIAEVTVKPKRKAKPEKEVIVPIEVVPETTPIIEAVAETGGDAKPKKKKKKHEHDHAVAVEVTQAVAESYVAKEAKETATEEIIEKVAEVIEEDTNTFKQFALNEKLLKAVNDLGYETPSPIQLKTIPLLLEGNDIVGQAQTGTGKTAAFALPALHRIEEKSNALQVLVLTHGKN
jgi:hypothetical protein